LKLRYVCFAVSAALVAASAGAQETRTYVFGTYYKCSEGTETRADAIYKQTAAPLVQKQIAAGNLAASGWARHWMGGDWRRLEYIGGTDLGKVVTARDAIIGELMSAHTKAMEEFSTICPSHDDYIWSSLASSQAPDAVARDRAKVAMSTYWVCDSREQEADEIFKAAFAPVMNAHVKQGKLVSWNWLEHVAGGKYRRLLVIDATDHKSVLAYWNAFDAALSEANPALFQRFIAICDSHSDYIWDLGTE